MAVDRERLLKLVPALAGSRVVVLGDLFLDEYIVGRATRLSREAPIPVLEFVRRFHLPGGAANPANNIVALGGEAMVVGVVGDDAEGERLIGALGDIGVDTAGVVTDPDRPTTLKTRILAEGTLVFPQQVARVDRQERAPVAGAVEDALAKHLADLIPQADAVLVSDYRSGVVTPRLVEACLNQAWRYGKLTSVDTQGNLTKFKGFELVRAHRRDVEAWVGHGLDSEADLALTTTRLLRELEAGLVLVGRGEEGMSVASRHSGYVHIPAANKTEVFDVTGAGDTVIAVATMGLLAGGTDLEAAHLANYAAGLVVRKLGNAVPTPDELTWAMIHW